MANRYIPIPPEDLARMREAVGVASVEELYPECLAPAAIGGPARASLSPEKEADLLALVDSFRSAHAVRTPLAGSGAERVEIPAICDWAASLGAFLTAYTPYQPEVAQGTLAVLFEFQTYVSEILGLPVAGAGVFDGGSALAEAVRMSLAETGRTRVLLAEAIAPRIRRVVATHLPVCEIATIPFDRARGVTPLAAVREALDEKTAAVVLAEPNHLGLLEPDIAEANEIARTAGAVPIAYSHPLALGALRSPGEAGAEIAAAEGQSLGTSLSAGGPYVGLLASTERFLRRFPGRIVGETIDREGRRAYCLTLQAREQHIRRERATSNICTNQTNNSLKAMVYLASLGPGGLREMGERAFAMTREGIRIARARGWEVLYPRGDDVALGHIVVRAPSSHAGAPPGVPADFAGAPPDARILSLWGIAETDKIEAAFA